MASSGKVSMSQVMEVLNSGKDADLQRIEPVRVDIYVDAQASRGLVEAIRDAFLPEQVTSQVNAALLAETTKAPVVRPDLCVIVGGGSDDAVRDAASTYTYLGVPVAIVAESVLDAPEPHLNEALMRLVSVAASSDYPTLLARLARWVVSTSEKSTAMAANFPFCRKAKVAQLIKTYASQNAAIGAKGSSGRSDVSVMTSNQAKLALEIAAAYGRPLTLERAQELAGVVSAGVGYRTFARGASKFVPGMGWAINAGVGYVGTMATANAIAAHFERLDAGAKALPRVRALLGTVAGALPAVGEAVARVVVEANAASTRALGSGTEGGES